MFTHDKTLAVINAGLIAVGAKPLDGIPVAAPGHTDQCVLGCSFGQFGASLLDCNADMGDGNYGEIDFDSTEVRDKILEAWQLLGVDCRESGRYRIRFFGGLRDWMRAFDGGEWQQLVVHGFKARSLDWDNAGEQPGDRFVDPAELPAVE